MTALDAPTQPRIARSRQLCPAPPPRRALAPSRAATIGVEPRRTVARARPQVVTHTLARPPVHVEPEPELRRSWRWVGVLLAALTAGLATGAALALTGVGVLPGAKPGPTSAQALGAVQRLGPQQSAAQEVTTTFDVDRSSFFGLGRPVSYRAVGTAQATVDLSAVGGSDVRVQGGHVTVGIPAAQLDTPVVDDTRSGPVNNRNRGSVDVSNTDLQDQLTTKAQDLQIPAAAQQLATARVRATLRRLGFATVTVRTPAS